MRSLLTILGSWVMALVISLWLVFSGEKAPSDYLYGKDGDA